MTRFAPRILCEMDSCSICRLDDDQCARHNAREYFDVVDPDYYEFEGNYTLHDCYTKIRRERLNDK